MGVPAYRPYRMAPQAPGTTPPIVHAHLYGVIVIAPRSRHHPEEPLLRRHLGRPTFLKIARSLKSGPLVLGMREDTGTATTPILRNYGYRAATNE
jgi:hypothetical protein